MSDVLFLDTINEALSTVHLLNMERFSVPTFIKLKDEEECRAFVCMFRTDPDTGKCVMRDKSPEQVKTWIQHQTHGEATARIMPQDLWSYGPINLGPALEEPPF